MNIIEAIKSGKRFTRPPKDYWCSGSMTQATLTREELLADDWEIDEEKLELTSAQVCATFEKVWYANVGRRISPPEVLKLVIAELGFK